MDDTYLEAADGDSEVPSGEFVPPLLESSRPLDDVIDVDVYIPGCPPDAEVLEYGLEALIEGEAPEIVGERLQYD
jgi:NAD-reducing hydrogenase small subunit